jgi:hypothetical protein
MQQQVEAAARRQRAAALGHFQEQRQRAEPFDMSADKDQPPRLVARHAVALRAADRAQLHRQVLQRCQHLRPVVSASPAPMDRRAGGLPSHPAKSLRAARIVRQ